MDGSWARGGIAIDKIRVWVEDPGLREYTTFLRNKLEKTGTKEMKRCIRDIDEADTFNQKQKLASSAMKSILVRLETDAKTEIVAPEARKQLEDLQKELEYLQKKKKELRVTKPTLTSLETEMKTMKLAPEVAAHKTETKTEMETKMEKLTPEVRRGWYTTLSILAMVLRGVHFMGYVKLRQGNINSCRHNGVIRLKLEFGDFPGTPTDSFSSFVDRQRQRIIRSVVKRQIYKPTVERENGVMSTMHNIVLQNEHVMGGVSQEELRWAFKKDI